MVNAQPKICPSEWYTQTPMGFWLTNGSLNLEQTTRAYNTQQKKKKKKKKERKKERSFSIVDFAVPVDHRVKLKTSEMKDKYFDLAMELKKKTVE